ncbi:MAG TPA: chondroitinase-B domain-containing protein, partial [Vicinamibacteria bacterium]
MTNKPLLRSSLLLAALAAAANASAQGSIGGSGAVIHLVDSIADLQASINAANPGDIILVRDGVYTTSAAININRRGTATLPIRISPVTLGGAEITGTHGFSVNSPSAYVQIWGFKFTHQSGRNQIRSGATHIRFTRNIFECTGDGAYLTVAGHDAEIDRNELRN